MPLRPQPRPHHHRRRQHPPPPPTQRSTRLWMTFPVLLCCRPRTWLRSSRCVSSACLRECIMFTSQMQSRLNIQEIAMPAAAPVAAAPIAAEPVEVRSTCSANARMYPSSLHTGGKAKGKDSIRRQARGLRRHCETKSHPGGEGYGPELDPYRGNPFEGYCICRYD